MTNSGFLKTVQPWGILEGNGILLGAAVPFQLGRPVALAGIDLLMGP